MSATATSGADPLATGKREVGLATTGWDILEVKSFGQFDDVAQMYGAGLVEGFLTADSIVDHLASVKASLWADGVVPTVIADWLNEQWTWSLQKSKAGFAEGHREWTASLLVSSQLLGMQAGLAAAQVDVDLLDLLVLNGVGDLLDLMSGLSGELKTVANMSSDDFFAYRATHGHCSAILKLDPESGDIFFSHASWFLYTLTNRIWKTYDMALTGVPGTSLSFSSYPGFLESLDDFYLLPAPTQQLAMVQTTNGNLNATLFHTFVKPQSLLAWQRVRMAMFLATSGPEWAEVLAFEHSGTYANQYMVLDAKLFEPGQPLPNHTLTVVEEVPGLVVSGDQTDHLRFGHWPSYNQPFYPAIRSISGFDQAEAKHGPRASWSMAPRAQIFRRQAGTVRDMATLKDLMRYNDYKEDPVASGDPMAAICSRGDLQAGDKAAPVGCYDTKVSKVSWLAEGRAEIINGPTRSHDLPAFSWSAFPNATKHPGLPATYDFDFIPVHSGMLGA